MSELINGRIVLSPHAANDLSKRLSQPSADIIARRNAYFHHIEQSVNILAASYDGITAEISGFDDSFIDNIESADANTVTWNITSPPMILMSHQCMNNSAPAICLHTSVVRTANLFFCTELPDGETA